MRGLIGTVFALGVAGCGVKAPGEQTDEASGLTAFSTQSDTETRTASSGTTAAAGDGTTAGVTTTGLPKLDLGELPDLGPGAETSGQGCSALVATIRDFQTTHADFETYGGSEASLGLVAVDLGASGKPVLNPAYAGAAMITSAGSFAQWYDNIAGTNQSFEVPLPLVEEAAGTYTYDNSAFFPLDDMGYGDEGNPHNFHFTTELHTQFTYQGGENFTFRGDDDLWLFVNGRLALDLGGLHPALEGTVEMDTLNLVPGQTYPMDIFHAERHTNESNFRISTNIDCFIPPVG
ncbi:MAG: fibro-slime domain-containing protein [Nannocystaceae bacterium]|nr:fibro-slime domain-containing protein [Nannocystaceae bacterium]